MAEFETTPLFGLPSLQFQLTEEIWSEPLSGRLVLVVCLPADENSDQLIIDCKSLWPTSTAVMVTSEYWVTESAVRCTKNNEVSLSSIIVSDTLEALMYRFGVTSVLC